MRQTVTNKRCDGEAGYRKPMERFEIIMWNKHTWRKPNINKILPIIKSTTFYESASYLFV